ncbi:MAG: NAD(P)-binding domain-containing protein [Brumimicrobium sp.]|nr:NAD(P)-binding domain-containing protein [Brumimicrobium sp.]
MNNLQRAKSDVFAVVGCGWLGLPVAQKLISGGNVVYGSTSTPQKMDLLRKENIRPILLTENDFYREQEWLKKCKVLLLNIPPSSFKESYADAMITLVRNLSSDARVIFISSTSVYGDHNQIAREDDTPDGTGRNAPYVIEAENSLKRNLKERLTIVRMAGLVGKKRHPVKHMSGKNYTGGKVPVNLIHLDDAVGLVLKIIEKEYWDELLNGCASKHPVKSDYYTKQAQKLGIKEPTFSMEEESYKLVSNERSVKELKYTYIFDDPENFEWEI